MPRLPWHALPLLLASIAIPLPAPAATEVILNSGQWQVLETEIGADEVQCDIRSRDANRGQDGDAYLYLIGNRDPDRGFDVRVVAGSVSLEGADFRAATIHYDEQPPIPAWGYPISGNTFGITPNLREMKLGGAVNVTVPLPEGEAARFSFSLIGFTNAYNRMVGCNR